MDVEQCYSGLLQIVGEGHSEVVLKQQERKVEQNLKKHARRIKHFYYWNKRDILGDTDKKDEKSLQLLKNK